MATRPCASWCGSRSWSKTRRHCCWRADKLSIENVLRSVILNIQFSFMGRLTQYRTQASLSLRQHGTSHFICVSVFALIERKNRNTKEDKVPLCRRPDRRLRKSCHLGIWHCSKEA